MYIICMKNTAHIIDIDIDNIYRRIHDVNVIKNRLRQKMMMFINQEKNINWINNPERSSR